MHFSEMAVYQSLERRLDKPRQKSRTCFSRTRLGCPAGSMVLRGFRNSYGVDFSAWPSSGLPTIRPVRRVRIRALPQHRSQRAWDNVSEMILRQYRSWYSLSAITDLVAFPLQDRAPRKMRLSGWCWLSRSLYSVQLEATFLRPRYNGSRHFC
jgi:hypothetical protein